MAVAVDTADRALHGNPSEGPHTLATAHIDVLTQENTRHQLSIMQKSRSVNGLLYKVNTALTLAMTHKLLMATSQDCSVSDINMKADAWPQCTALKSFPLITVSLVN